jgi:hypothetical protein
MIPSLEELRKRLVPVVGPDSAPNSLFKRKPRLSTTPTRNLPLSSDSPAPQQLSAPACDHSSAQTAPLGDRSAVEQPGAEIGVDSAHSYEQIVQDLAGETVLSAAFFASDDLPPRIQQNSDDIS